MDFNHRLKQLKHFFTWRSPDEHHLLPFKHFQGKSLSLLFATLSEFNEDALVDDKEGVK